VRAADILAFRGLNLVVDVAVEVDERKVSGATVVVAKLNGREARRGSRAVVGCEARCRHRPEDVAIGAAGTPGVLRCDRSDAVLIRRSIVVIAVVCQGDVKRRAKPNTIESGVE
jgi:hypothetical protein